MRFFVRLCNSGQEFKWQSASRGLSLERELSSVLRYWPWKLADVTFKHLSLYRLIDHIWLPISVRCLVVTMSLAYFAFFRDIWSKIVIFHSRLYLTSLLRVALSEFQHVILVHFAEKILMMGLSTMFSHFDTANDWCRCINRPTAYAAPAYNAMLNTPRDKIDYISLSYSILIHGASA